MDDIRGNSIMEREEEPKTETSHVEKPVVDVGKTRKRSGLGKFFRSLIAEDLPSVKEHILGDILRPSIANFIIDTVSDGIRMVFGGDRDSKSSSYRPISTVSYRDYYDKAPRPYAYDPYSYDSEDPIVPTRADAERVRNCMEEILDKYKYVRVADLLDLCNCPSRYTDNKYGWCTIDEIRRAKIIRTRDGQYVIEMPSPRPLD